MTINIINLTKHAICLADEGGCIVATIQPSGVEARVSTTQKNVGNINGVALNMTVYGEVTGIPEPQENTVYVVSSLIAARALRSDVVSPDTGATAVRQNGQVIAVRAFQTFVDPEN